MQVEALEAAGMIEIKEGKKCWKGYKKAGTQKLFGKTYNRCVKAGDELNHDGEQLQEMNPSFNIDPKKHNQEKKQAKVRKVMEKPGTEGEGQAAQNVIKDKTQLPKLPMNKQMFNQQTESYAKVTEGVAFLKREKEKKNLSRSI